MTTLASLHHQKGSPEHNNFLLIRLIAATLVVYGHSFPLATVPSRYPDVVAFITKDFFAHTTGLDIFFIISGFLVTASWCDRENLPRFLVSRALRILPGLLVCGLVISFTIGPLFSTLPARNYFLSPDAWSFFLHTVLLQFPPVQLPSLHFSTTVHGAAINGSLWTIPVEARLYLLVALCGVFGLARNLALANMTLGLLVIAAVAAPTYLPLVEANEPCLRVASFFGVGAFAYINRNFIPVRIDIFALLVLVAAFSFFTQSYALACSILLIYGVISLAYGPKIPLPSMIHDYSYGIYLYSFPIQQVLVHTWPAITPYRLAIIAIPLSWLAGALSWHLVEKPSLDLKKRMYNPSQRPAPAGLPSL